MLVEEMIHHHHSLLSWLVHHSACIGQFLVDRSNWTWAITGVCCAFEHGRAGTFSSRSCCIQPNKPKIPSMMLSINSREQNRPLNQPSHPFRYRLHSFALWLSERILLWSILTSVTSLSVQVQAFATKRANGRLIVLC